MNIKKVAVIFFLAIALILTSCGAAPIDYAEVGNDELWAGHVGRAVTITGTVVTPHYAPYIYSANNNIVVIERQEQLIYLFCLDTVFFLGEELAIKGTQLPVRNVKVPSPTGYNDEYIVAICVNEFTLNN